LGRGTTNGHDHEPTGDMPRDVEQRRAGDLTKKSGATAVKPEKVLGSQEAGPPKGQEKQQGLASQNKVKKNGLSHCHLHEETSRKGRGEKSSVRCQRAFFGTG